MDTVFAPSTAPGLGAVAVIRLSGPGAVEAYGRLAGRAPDQARHLRLESLRDPTSGEVLDRALAVWFPAPRSFSGEDVVELHIHGGRATVRSVMDALAALPGLRVADPGEFTLRAFRNGRMDLTAAEGLADLVAADTTAQRRQALAQMDGALERLYESWRSRLIDAMGLLEATIDFSDQDIPDGLHDAVAATVDDLKMEIAGHLDDKGRGEALRDGVQVAIIGPPNVGKSSLLNLLAGREAAIVAETAGTTRDVIEVRMDLAGYAVVVADTAGLRESDDSVEREGVRRALDRAARSDLKLLVYEAADPSLAHVLRPGGLDENSLVVMNKIDLHDPPGTAKGHPAALPVSVRTGAGIDCLLKRLGEAVAERCAGEGTALTRARHRRSIVDCAAALERFAVGEAPETAAEELRLAARALGRITGRVDVDDVLDRIFGRFCIGK